MNKKITLGSMLTYNECLAHSGSVVKGKNLPGRPSVDFFKPTSIQEANTPLGILFGTNDRNEIESARRVGAIGYGLMGLGLTNGAYEPFISLEPLNEQGYTQSDFIIGKGKKELHDGKEHIIVEEDPALFDRIRESLQEMPQQLLLREQILVGEGKRNLGERK